MTYFLELTFGATGLGLMIAYPLWRHIFKETPIIRPDQFKYTQVDPQVLKCLASKAELKALALYSELGPYSETMHLEHIAHQYRAAAEEVSE
jgi:hypothetical protein